MAGKNTTFTTNLKKVIADSGLGNHGFAEKAKMPYSTLMTYLSKKNYGRVAEWDQLIKIANAASKSIEWLLTGEEKEVVDSSEKQISPHINPDVLEILECDDDDIKSDLISYAKRLKERNAEREERRAMKVLLEELAKIHRKDTTNEAPKNSDSRIGDQEETDADPGDPETGMWGF